MDSSLSCAHEEAVADADDLVAAAVAADDAEVAVAAACGGPGDGGGGGLAPPWISRVSRRTLRRMKEYLPRRKNNDRVKL